MRTTPKGIGWRVVVGTCLAGLAVACGGGSDPASPTVIPLTTTVFAGWTGTYLAKFDVTGEMLTPTNTLEPITGTLELADQAGTSTSPTSLLTGVDRLVTWTLNVGSTPTLERELEHLYVDGSGNWFEQGLGPAGGVLPCSTPIWWHGTMPGPTLLPYVDSRLFLHGPTEAVGSSVWVAPTPMEGACGPGDVGDAAWEREVVGTESVTTPLGTYECYRVEAQRIRNGDSFVRITTTRWERPELGLVAMDTVHEENNLLFRIRRETHARLISHSP